MEIFHWSYCLPNLWQAKRKQVYYTKTQKFVFVLFWLQGNVIKKKRNKKQFLLLFFFLCSFFFILFSLFFGFFGFFWFFFPLLFVLCSFSVSRLVYKRTTVSSSFLGEEFLWCKNTPLLFFIYHKKMC